MYKVNKTIKKQIGMLAGQLPVTFYDANESGISSGKRLIENGVTEISGVPIEEDKTYTRTIARPHVVNHKRRMIEAFKSEGQKGLEKYIAQLGEIFNPPKINLHSKLI